MNKYVSKAALPPARDSADLSLIRLLIGAAMPDNPPGIVGKLPGMFGNGIPAMLDMLGIGGIGVLPADGAIGPPPGDLTAETNADIDAGDTCETPKFGGG